MKQKQVSVGSINTGNTNTKTKMNSVQ